MKRVIDGKVYNTETAEEIGSYSYGYRGDFNRVEETLYKTKKGSFFLAGNGGPQSKYGYSPRQNELCGGYGMSVLTEEEACNWCENHDIDAEIIAANFKIEEG